MKSRLITVILWILVLEAFSALPVRAETREAVKVYEPNRYGLSVGLGKTYTPVTDMYLALVSGFILYDYDQVWHHRAPEALRFKVEAAAGTAMGAQTGFVASTGVLALYYLDRFSGLSTRPYVEGGIGVIFTDFQFEKQGLRINFNPQLGAGMEFKTPGGLGMFLGLRLHHVSNANLHEDNHGINTLLLQIGRYF